MIHRPLLAAFAALVAANRAAGTTIEREPVVDHTQTATQTTPKFELAAANQFEPVSEAFKRAPFRSPTTTESDSLFTTLKLAIIVVIIAEIAITILLAASSSTKHILPVGFCLRCSLARRLVDSPARQLAGRPASQPVELSQRQKIVSL